MFVEKYYIDHGRHGDLPLLGATFTLLAVIFVRDVGCQYTDQWQI